MAYVYADQIRQDLLDMLPVDGKIIGSIGCGTAATEAVMLQRGREVHGVDISPEAIAVAATRLTSARLVDATDFSPFADNFLDGLILADVIEHIPRAWQALSSFTRAVKPGGWVMISVPNMRNLHSMYQIALLGDWPEDDLGIFDVTHVQFMTQARLERWCRTAGLEIEKWHDKPIVLHGHRRETAARIFARLTHDRYKSWFQYQLQVICRKPRRPGG